MRKFLILNWLKDKDFLWEARTRIFAWYVGLSTLLVGLSIPLFTQLAVFQVNKRVREDLLEEIAAFEQSYNPNFDKDIAIIFDRFLQYKIPADKTFLIATINGEFYRSSPVGLPPTISYNSPLIKNLANSKQPIREQNLIVDEQVGGIIYKAEPVKIDGQIQGVFIVANIVAGERKEILAAILRELTKEMYRKMQALGKRNWQIDNLVQTTAKIDRQRIIQAVMNLADNAVKYTQTKDIIALGCTKEKQYIRFWVRDTGCGIPPQDQERIFERFVRSSNNQNNAPGTGLGLSIVAAIAKSHRGRVELYSQLGKGSTFTIVLPQNNT